MRITVGKEAAELVSTFCITHPYPPIGDTLKCEANIIGLTPCEGLDLEFWAETPSGEFKNLTQINTKELTTGEEAYYSAKSPLKKKVTTLYMVTYIIKINE